MKILKDYRLNEVGYWNLASLMKDYTKEILDMGILINTDMKKADIEGYTEINWGVYISNKDVNNFIEITKKTIELFNCYLDEKKYKYEDIFNKEVERELSEGTSEAHSYSIACFNHITQMDIQALDLLEFYNPVFWDLEYGIPGMEYEMNTYKRK